MNADKRRCNAANLRSSAFICGSNFHKFGVRLYVLNVQSKSY